MSFRRRIDHLERAARAARPDPAAGLLSVIVVRRVGADPDGRPPGFYPPTVPGSSVADLVYDPAGGEPAIPSHRLAPHGLVISLHPDPILPPT